MVHELDQVIRPEFRAAGVLVTVANHYVAVKDSHYIDIWDSGYKCVGNYFIKVKNV